jgi:F-box protein 18 (helicase)
MKPTEEQTAVVETEAPILVIRAFAGAGKTSTLVEFAKKRSQKRMLYIVFSKQNQKDAEQKFRGTMVKPTTSHALAFRYTGVPYKDQLVTGLKPYQVEKALGISRELSCEVGYKSSYNNDMMVTSVVLESLIKFLYSIDKEIQAKHVHENHKRLEKLFSDMNENAIKQMIVIQTKKLWAKMIDPRDRDVGMVHDGYLKLFQLSEPDLSNYEYWLVDESQDLNPVTLSIIFRQSGKKVLVGDSHQAIYGWRGARNALGFAVKQGGVERYLTGSFRFGANIARVANRILAIKGETISVQGLAGEDRVGKISENECKTVISRSNAGVFSQTAQAMHNEESWWHVGGSEGYRFGQILEIYYMWARRSDMIRDPFIQSFTDFNELKFYGEAVDDVEIKSRCKIVEDYRDNIPVIIDKINRKVGAAYNMDSAEIVMTTSHKSKGLEFPNVQLDDDFIELCEIPEMTKLDAIGKAEVLKEISEELNILYVAATRAQKVLQPNFDLTMFLNN